MNRNMIIVLSAIILALIGIIVAGVCVLYSPASSDGARSSFVIENAAEDSVDVDSVPTLDHPLSEKQTQESQPQEINSQQTQPQSTSFTVRNSATGKDNTLVQKEDNSIELIDHTGKSLWTVSLPERICGEPAQVDCFSNGKIQYMIVVGSLVHVFDRLGREVKGWPVNLSRKALSGPSETASKGKKYYTVDCEGGAVFFTLNERKILTQLP